jgi:hypothetical protein
MKCLNMGVAQPQRPAASLGVSCTTLQASTSLATSTNELDEDVELVNRMKARYRRRLQERWSCDVQDHSYCFSDMDGAHIPLSEDAIEAWTSALVRTMIFLLYLILDFLRSIFVMISTTVQQHC